MADRETVPQHWMLDKRIPLALIVTIVMQTGGAIYWVSTIAATVAQQSAKIAALEATRAAERLAVVESRVDDFKQQLNRIEGKIDKLSERTP